MSEEEAALSGSDESCPALLEAAHPDVYRRNAFRVLGLSVEVTPRDISRHTEKLQMMRKYKSAAVTKTPLALKPPPDEHAEREALHKLHDPERRLIDEFLWFWPHELGRSKTDQALTLLAGNDVKGAAKRWHQMEESSESHVSMHNMAVLFHCLALDYELAVLDGRTSSEKLETADKYWREAFKRWSLVLEHEPFWSRLTARIRALEDPRLTTGLARRMRASLPLALLSINATLAVRYAEAGDWVAARRQVDTVKRWTKGSGPGALSDAGMKALREALGPLRSRIKSICKKAEGDAGEDAAHGDKTTREVIEQTRPLLVILDRLLPAEDATRDAAHDEVAVCALHCQIAFGNMTKNWKVSQELLEMALAVVVGQAVRSRIEENINTVKGNMEYDTCWFCGQNPNDDAAALEVKMYGDVVKTPTWNGTHITWRYGTVKVPRCAECKEAHGREETCLGVGAVLGGLLGIGGCLAITSSDEGMCVGGGIVLAVLLAIGAGIGAAVGAAKRPEGTKPASAKNKFPSIKRLLDQGWQFGERPNTQ